MGFEKVVILDGLVIAIECYPEYRGEPPESTEILPSEIDGLWYFKHPLEGELIVAKEESILRIEWRKFEMGSGADDTAEDLKAANSPLKVQVGGSHYKDFKIQPVEYTTANGLSFLQGCIVKRTSRYNKPTGKGLEDLKKVKHEIDLIIELEEWEKQ